MAQFDPKRYLIKVQGGRMYLPVSARVLWFRQEKPDWGIETETVALDLERQYAIFRTKIYDETGRLMATGTKHEDVRGFPDYIEKSETGSIGRALALCGFGTQFAPEFDEIDLRKGDGRPVDTPQPLRSGRQAAPRAQPGVRTEEQRPEEAADTSTQDADPQALSCGKCKKALTRSQHELSMRHYDEALCPNCQKARAAQQSMTRGAA